MDNRKWTGRLNVISCFLLSTATYMTAARWINNSHTPTFLVVLSLITLCLLLFQTWLLGRFRAAAMATIAAVILMAFLQYLKAFAV